MPLYYGNISANSVTVTEGNAAAVPVSITGAAAQTSDFLDVTYSGGTAGNMFKVAPASSSTQVDGITITTAATGSPGRVQIAATGSDSSIQLDFLSKLGAGIGFHNDRTAGLTNYLFAMNNTTNTDVNAVQSLSNGTGAAPGLAAFGSDTNVSLQLNTQGTGSLLLPNATGRAVSRTIGGTTYLTTQVQTASGTIETMSINGGAPASNVMLQVGSNAAGAVGFNSSILSAAINPKPTQIGTGDLVANLAQPIIQGGATVTNLYGFWSLCAAVAASAVTNSYSFNVSTPTIGGGATITNAYGLNIAAQKTAGVTNGFGINQIGTSDVNTFNGPTAIHGTNTNDNASAGFVGEFVTGQLASGSATSLSNGTSKTITSVSLTAGDWDVEGVVDIVLAAATVTNFKGGTSTTTNTLGAQDTFVSDASNFIADTDTQSLIAPRTRYSLSTTTTVYLIGQVSFSAGTCTGYGTINCRRVR